MSRLILGGGSLGGMDQKSVDTLISVALNAGMTSVDTAPIYADSEVRIGEFLRRNKNEVLNISTKVGIPASLILNTKIPFPRIFNPEELSPSIINESVRSSLVKLRVESIDTIYLHSVDSAHFTDENIAALLNLKKLGLVKKLGYAGDGFHLECALKLSEFDTFMITLNCIDQMNMPYARSVCLERRLIVKRALGNAIWRSKNYSISRRAKDELAQFALLDKKLRALLKVNAKRGFTSYEYRLNKMFGRSGNQDFTNIFYNFVLSIPNVESVLLGTTSPDNLLRAIEIESEVERLSESELAIMESNFDSHANASWGAQT